MTNQELEKRKRDLDLNAAAQHTFSPKAAGSNTVFGTLNVIYNNGGTVNSTGRVALDSSMLETSSAALMSKNLARLGHRPPGGAVSTLVSSSFKTSLGMINGIDSYINQVDALTKKITELETENIRLKSELKISQLSHHTDQATP